MVTENAIKKSKTQGLKEEGSDGVLVLGWVSMEKLYKRKFLWSRKMSLRVRIR